jgi:hypothetical protein
MALDKDKVEVYEALANVIMRLVLACVGVLILFIGFGFLIYFLYIDKYGSAAGIFVADSVIVAVILLIYKYYFK